MRQEAEANLERLRGNRYPGRGIIIGLDETGRDLVQVYWIMGRSANSRNRVFASRKGRLWTEAADPAAVEDPSLIIYNAMAECEGHFYVTNGDQTDTLVRADRAGISFLQALQTRLYEPDAPNYTPRISGFFSLRKGRPAGALSLLKRSTFGAGCDRHFFLLEELGAGMGRCITTYQGDGDPLPPFRGEPCLLPLEGDIEACAAALWEVLDGENRVSLAVKFIDRDSGRSRLHIVNKYGKKG